MAVVGHDTQKADFSELEPRRSEPPMFYHRTLCTFNIAPINAHLGHARLGAAELSKHNVFWCFTRAFSDVFVL